MPSIFTYLGIFFASVIAIFSVAVTVLIATGNAFRALDSLVGTLARLSRRAADGVAVFGGERSIRRQLRALEDQINYAAMQLSFHGKLGFSRSLKLKLLRSDVPASSLPESFVVVRIDDNCDVSDARRIAVKAYADEAVAPEALTVLPINEADAVRNLSAHKILKFLKDERAIARLQRESQSADEHALAAHNKAEEIDERQLLFSCLIPELLELQASEKPELLHAKRQIGRAAFDFIYDIASRGYEEETDLLFRRPGLSFALVLLGKRAKLKTENPEPYVTATAYKFADGADRVYLALYGTDDATVHQSVVVAAVKEGVAQVLDDLRLAGTYLRDDLSLQVCRLTRLGPGVATSEATDPLRNARRDAEGELREILNAEVPGIRLGSVVVLAVAREPGLGSKVLVRSKDPKLRVLPSVLRHQSAIVAALNGEWCRIGEAGIGDDPQVVVRNVLSARADAVADALHDAERALVTIIPSEATEVSYLLGRHKANLELTRRVCLAAIGVDVALGAPRLNERPSAVGQLASSQRHGFAVPKRMHDGDTAGTGISTSSGTTAVDELKAVLADIVPEIAAGDIAIVGAARRVGVGSKIIVSARDPQEIDAATIVRAYHRDLRAALAGEWYNLVEDEGSDIGEIVSKLLTNERSDIARVEVNDDACLTKIFSTDGAAKSRLLGYGGINFELTREAWRRAYDSDLQLL
jgi:transcription antitermination factor NusA-like protein